MDNIEKLREMIVKSKNIVFFGGAGVSTESGIPDFRSVDGLYSQKYKYPPEAILSHDFFMQRTEEFYKFYFDKMIFPDAKPNAAHYKLAEMEQKGYLKCIITQNIDGLHYMAGSKNVCEFHGTVHKNHCLKCGKEYNLSEMLQKSGGVPRCDCGGIIKPDVVLYGESIPQEAFEKSIEAVENCDLLIIGGTSLKVQPAASLVTLTNARKVVINKDRQEMETFAELSINEPIGEVFSKIIL